MFHIDNKIWVDWGAMVDRKQAEVPTTEKNDDKSEHSNLEKIIIIINIV